MLRMEPGRPVQRWLIAPPLSTPQRPFEEPLTREFVWLQLRPVQENPQIGQALFSGTLAAKRQNWVLLRNYLRQARLNDEAAQHLHGSSAALLHYYTALNLAKAILLSANPQSIVGQKIGHGLSYNPATAAKHESDFVTVQTNGVFPLLYELVTGVPIAAGTKLPIRRLLQQVPEVGGEIDELGLATTKAWPMYTIVAFDAGGTEMWSVVAILGWPDAQKSIPDISTKHLLKSYRRIDRFSNWRQLFGMNPRSNVGAALHFLESKQVYPASLGSGHAAAATWLAFYPLIEHAPEYHREALYCPSLYATKMLPFPSYLARYALIFYLSSLVRYRPDWLDPYLHGGEALLFDSLADTSMIFLLASSLNYLRRTTYSYDYARSVG